ncbi:MAG: D-amino-acid transaminase [Rhodospirillales bacterium]
MSRIAYVNGVYVPHADAAVHVEDRGYQFADGVYEVVTVVDGKLIDEEPHLDRLDRSLRELDMASPMGRPSLKFVLREIVRRNRVRTGIVYFQVTRGVAKRDHPYPRPPVSPSIVATAKSMPALARPPSPDGISVVTVPDIRWGRCDIKTVGLLPNCMAKQHAVESGANDAWMTDENGNVTEGSASNAWIVTADGELVTRPTSDNILNGITRRRMTSIAEQQGLKIVERAFSVDEAKNAKEAFQTSASGFPKPVTRIDGTSVGNGRMGELTAKLHEHYMAFVADAPAT